MVYSEKWVKSDYHPVIATDSFIGTIIGVDDMNLLQTLTASNSATLTSTINLSSTYDRYMILLENILPNVPGDFFRVRYNVGGVQTTNYVATNIQNLLIADAPTTHIALIGGTNGMSTSVPGGCGIFNLIQPWSSTNPKWMFGNSAYLISTSSNAVNCQGAGYYAGSNNAVTALEFSMNSSNIASGTVKIYGIYGT